MILGSNQRNTWRRLFRNKSALCGMVIIILCVLIAVFAYFISPDSSPDANRMVVEIGGLKPGTSQQFLRLVKEEQPAYVSLLQRVVYGLPDRYDYIPVNACHFIEDSVIAEKFIDEGVSERMAVPRNIVGDPPVVIKKFYLGTDKYGRDILSRLLVGVRVSLGVGLVTVILSVLIGVLLGALAGYFLGRVDAVIMWFINVVWSIPTLLLVFAITLVLGKGFWQVFIAIGLTTWVNVARLIRGQVIAIRKLEYVDAARVLGLFPGAYYRQAYPPQCDGTGDRDRGIQLCIGDRNRSGSEFFGCGCATAATQLGFDDQGELQFHYYPQPHAGLGAGFCHYDTGAGF